MTQIDRLIKIMIRLRNKETGCPWDLKQTPKSLKKYILEEAYEVLDAIDDSDPNEIKKELGDLLLQVVFQSQMFSEQNLFSFDDVAKGIADKLELRHPHIFEAESHNLTADEVSVNWEKIKKSKEGKKRILDGVPRNFNSMLRSLRLQEKAAAVGFDWPDEQGILDKINEEFGELQEGIKNKDYDNIEEELGDLFFVMVKLAKRLKVNPEEALNRCNDKFIRRFGYIENQLAKKNIELQDQTLEELDKVWDEAKGLDKQGKLK